jgi:transposase
MTAIVNRPITTAILAVDLGKYKCVACVYQPADAAARFLTFDTSRQQLDTILQQHPGATIVIEACTLSGWIHDLCRERGRTCLVANTAAEAWKFKHAKRKTDRDDALRLAQLAALGQLPIVTVPDKSDRERRALIAARQALVGRRVAVHNRIRALFVGQGLPAPRGHRAWTEIGLAGLAQHARPLADCGADELWRGLLALALLEYRQFVALVAESEAKLDALGKVDERVQLLDTIPGVGPRTAETVAAYLGDPHRFKHGKEVSAFGGLVPKQFQSGESDRRGRITRRGPALLRKLLVECAWCMLRYNAWAKATWLRLTHGGKTHRKQAIVALARKLLVRCWAMLRDGTPWRSTPTASPAPA